MEYCLEYINMIYEKTPKETIKLSEIEDTSSENNKNITENDLNNVLNLKKLFSVYDTYYNALSQDLYFVGIKKGNYNFNSLEKYVNNGVVNTTSNIGV